MTTVTLDSFRMNAHEPPLTIERVYQRYATWAGILSHKFDDRYIGAGTGWSGSPSISFSDSALTIDATALASQRWPVVQNSITTPGSQVVTFDIDTGDRWLVILGYEDTNLFYYIGAGSTGLPVVYRNNELVHRPDKQIPAGGGHVVAALRQVQFTDNETEVWYALSLWINGQHITTYLDKRAQAISNIKFGFGVLGNVARTFSNIRVPELSDMAEWGTLDPGETAYSGLSRVTEGRYLRQFVRFNGQFYAYRSKAKSLTKALTASDDLIEGEVTVDAASLFSHVRMMGAYTWGEALDATLLSRYGHRFAEVNNPMLMTEIECYEEAVKTLKRGEEAAFTEDVQVVFQPFLEVDDRVTTPNGDWLVSGLETSFGPGVIRQGLRLRRYVWG